MERILESEENKIIAKFMGYIYYHPGVDVDYSDCGGIYNRVEVFSKIPILVNEYPEDDQYYFTELPNPDYGKEEPERWRSDLKTIPWDSIHGKEYTTQLKYDKSWNSLMKVIEKIEELGINFSIAKNVVSLSGRVLVHNKYIKYIWFSGITNDSKLKSAYIATLEFCKWYLKVYK